VPFISGQAAQCTKTTSAFSGADLRRAHMLMRSERCIPPPAARTHSCPGPLQLLAASDHADSRLIASIPVNVCRTRQLPRRRGPPSGGRIALRSRARKREQLPVLMPYRETHRLTDEPQQLSARRRRKAPRSCLCWVQFFGVLN
jgi:hypothetical protein